MAGGASSSSGRFLLGRMIVVWLAAMVLLHASPAAGDGIYIPEQAVPTLPAIPTQRAMIVYRNGEETLVVESTFQSPSRDVGWILPVPAEPTKLELGEPGMLTSLSMSLRPSVTHELPAQIAYVAWAIILGLPVIVAIYLSIRTLNSTIIYVLVAVAAFFFYGDWSPTLSHQNLTLSLSSRRSSWFRW